MPSVKVSVKGGGRALKNHPHVVIVGETGTRVVLPLAPQTTHDNLAMKFATADRIGDYPLSSKVGNPAATIGLEIALIGRDSTQRLSREASVEPLLQLLRGFARTGERIQFLSLGRSAGGWYEITSLSFGGDETKQHGTNDITGTVVHVNVQKASNQLGNVGALSGGAQGVDPKARTVSVRSGEPLYAASYRATGEPRNWRTIAEANGILAPYRLAVGTTLRVPRRV